MYNPKQEAPMKKKIATLMMMCRMASSALFAQCKIMSYNIRNGRGMDEVCIVHKDTRQPTPRQIKAPLGNLTHFHTQQKDKGSPMHQTA